MSGKELLQEYRTMLGELKELHTKAGPLRGQFEVATGRNEFDLSVIRYKREILPEAVSEIDTYFKEAAKLINRVRNLRERFEEHTASRTTLPRTKKALANLTEIHEALHSGILEHARQLLKDSMDIVPQHIASGERSVSDSGVRLRKPITREKLEELSTIAARHVGILSRMPR